MLDDQTPTKHAFVYWPNCRTGRKTKTNHMVYILSTGRVCIAVLNTRNINRVVEAIGEVL